MQKDYEAAYEYCRKIAVSHYENFPVGSVLIPKDKRKYVYAVYAFARFADDTADSNDLSEETKLIRLEELETELDKIEGLNVNEFTAGTEKIFTALSDTVRVLNIPVMEFRKLLSAFKQDSVCRVYDDFGELLDYSERSANPIGHLVLYVFGYDLIADKKMFSLSDKVCTALQLTNFWQDVSEDLKIDRVYIPADVLNENNYSADKLYKNCENDDFRNIIKNLVNKTDELFIEGTEIINLLSGRLKLELKATIFGGREILNKIRRINYSVLNKRVTLSRTDKIKIIFRALTN